MRGGQRAPDEASGRDRVRRGGKGSQPRRCRVAPHWRFRALAPCSSPAVKRPPTSIPRPTALVRAALQRELGGWFRSEQRALPWRETRDPFAIWISEAMLQQTRVET